MSERNARPGFRVQPDVGPEPVYCPDCQGLDEDCICDVDEELDDDPGAECGRWSNGRLMKYCSKAGSEECDFECPHR